MEIDFSTVRKKAQKKYGIKSGEFQKDSSGIDFAKVREQAGKKYGTPVHDKKFGSQNDQPKYMADSSAGTADFSGPRESTHDDEPDYLSYSQPASNYAAGYQGSLSQSSTPYAAGLQAGIKEEPEKEKKKWKRVGPVSMREEPEWLNMTSEEIGALREQTVEEKNKLGEEIFKKTAASTVPTSAAASGQYTKPEGNPYSSSAAVSGTWKDPEAESVAELRQELVQKEDKVSELAGAQYHVRNREAKARLQEDEEAWASYDTALKLTEELDAVSKYLAAPSYYNGMDSLWQSKGEAVSKQYDAEDLEALRKQLQAQKDQAVEALAAKGYDFEDMAGYDQMLRRQEAYEKSRERFQREAEEHPFWSSAATILASPAQGMDYARTVLNGVGHSDPNKLESYVPADVYDMYATNFVRTVRGTVAEKLAENPAFQTEIGGQNVYSFLYQTGMSMGDFLFNSLLTGSFSGGLAGTGSKASIEAAKNLSLAIMGTSAAANATAEAIERGLSNRQAYTLGAIAGFAEALTEKFSLDALLDGKWEDGAVKYILKNAFTEGTEEVGSDLINWAGDLLVSRDKSQWKQAIKGYEERGYSQGEAFGLALRDQAKEMGMDFLGGYLSGGIMSGSNVAVNGANVQTETLVSDEAADKLLNDRTSVAFLEKHGNLNLQKGMTQEQKRAAVRQAVENVVHKEKAASDGMTTEEKAVTLDQAVPISEEEPSVLQKNMPESTDNRFVSDETVDQMLRERTVVEFLTRKGDLKLKKKMSQEQKRVAVREAINRIIKVGMERTLPREIQGKDFAVREENDTLSKTARFSALGGIQDGREETKADKAVTGRNAGTPAQVGDRSGVQKEIGGILEGLGGMAAHRREIADSSFGAQPVKAWAKEALVTPIDGSVAQEEQQTVQEFYIPSYVIQDEIWEKENYKEPAFASHGQIYFRASLPEEYRGTFGRHELIHVMKQLSYQPYLDFVERVPEMLNFATEEARDIARGAADHCKIDLFNMNEDETIRVYDEVNAILWGHIGSGKLFGLEEQVRRAFFDFDAYAAELRSIFERFKRERQAQFG